MPKITICVPTYNRAHYLREALDSILNQSFQDFEIIVSDDNSSDDTYSIVMAYGDKRLIYRRNQTNLGLSANLRKAIEEVKTEFLAIINDDDLMLTDHLEVGLDALRRYPSATYYSAAARYFGDISYGELRPLAIDDLATPLVFLRPETAVDFLGLDLPGTAHIVARTEALDRLYWGPPGFLAPDLLMLTQMMARGGCVFGNHATTCFRTHSANTSMRAEQSKRRRFNLMVWHGIRWLCNYLTTTGIATAYDIEKHGITSQYQQHVVPLVLSLSSFYASTSQRAIAERIFQRRRDMDCYSARMRVARKLGYWTFPIGERLTQVHLGWSP